jgi:hypothetical protein
VSANVAALTKGAVNAMFLTKVKVATAVLLAIGVIGAGAGTFGLPHLDTEQKQPRQESLSLHQKGKDDNDANAVLDKAIKAIGGEARLHKAKAIAWKARGKSVNNGNEQAFTNQTTVQGLDQLRMEYEEEIDGNLVKGVTVLNGDKGWRKNGDNFRKLDGDRLANQKRNLYLLVVPVTLIPLKGKAFQIEPAGEHNVGAKPAIGLKVTGPDGKDFNLFFDKESALPVKLEVRIRSPGREFTEETTFGDYKDFDGIKKATKIERRRDGEKFLEQEITEFKVLDKLAPETFAQPQ